MKAQLLLDTRGATPGRGGPPALKAIAPAAPELAPGGCSGRDVLSLRPSRHPRLALRTATRCARSPWGESAACSQPVPPPPGDPSSGTAAARARAAGPRGNVGLGIVAAVVAALVPAGAYGAHRRRHRARDRLRRRRRRPPRRPRRRQGRRPQRRCCPCVSAPCSLGAVYLGQLLGIAASWPPTSGRVRDATSSSTGVGDLATWNEAADAHDLRLPRHRRVRRLRRTPRTARRLHPHAPTRRGPAPPKVPGPFDVRGVSVRSALCCESATVTSTRWNSFSSL